MKGNETVKKTGPLSRFRVSGALLFSFYEIGKQVLLLLSSHILVFVNIKMEKIIFRIPEFYRNSIAS